ncbi:hypothetical protein AWN76_007375 [Rhodothermaceae bacterium RA]|nr:hypothetical protein AWN76_007375 [Rhodothermaceae bacterium RA]
MSSPLQQTLIRMQRTLRVLCGGALLGAVGALLGEAWLVTQRATPEAHTIGLVALLLFGYFGRKVFQIYRSIRTLRQLRLEQAFVRHADRLAKRRQCLHRCDHLWNRSYILTALRAVAARPMPRLLLAEKRLQHVADHIHRGLHPLRFGRLNLDLLLLLLALGHLAVTPLSASGPLLLALFAGTAALLLAEMLQSVLLWRLHRNLHTLEATLGTWTLHGPFSEALHEPERKPYVHTLLYRDRPWFSAPASVRNAA